MNIRNGSWTGLAVVFLGVLASASLTRPLLPVDETRYASVAWEMWQRGDFLVPYLNGEPYSHKPPLFFWLIHAGWWLFGVHEWVVRAIAPLTAAVTLPALVLLARRLWPADDMTARLVPWILFSCVFFTAFFSWVQIDLLLVLFTVLAMAGMVSASRGRVGGWLLAGLAVGLGILAKGPVILVQVLPVALLAPLWKRADTAVFWRRWYPGLGISMAIAALIALGWALPAAEAGGEAYGDAILWGQTADRMVQSFAHAHPVWWYLPWLPVLFAPWSLLPWLWPAFRQTRPVQDEGMRFCLTWLVASLIILSLVSGKQIKYLLPLLPAFVLLLARVLSRMDPAAISRREWLLAMVLLAAGVAGSVLPLVLQQAAWLNMVHPVWGVLLVAGAIAVVWLRPATPVRYPLIMTLVSAYAVCIAQLGAFRVAAPAYDLHDASHQVARLQAAGREVASVTRYHGQFGFYGRLVRPIVQLEAGEVLSWAARHPDDFLVLTAGDIPESGLPEALHVQAYRGGYLAILEGRGLLNEPAVLP